MKREVKKIGNSLFVRIGTDIAMDNDIEEGDLLEIKIDAILMKAKDKKGKKK